MAVVNKTWILKHHPEGHFEAQRDVELVEENIDLSDTVDDHEILVQTDAFSVDAFLRTMLDPGAFHGTVKPGLPLRAVGRGKIVQLGKEAAKQFKMGQTVQGLLPVALYARCSSSSKTDEGSGLMGVMDLFSDKPSLSLGLLGLTGLTAYTGVFLAAKGPKKGETVVVSAAAGATGSVAAQLARLQGGRVIGVAGGPKKNAYLTETLGLAGAVDYKNSEKTLGEQLDEMCPDGIDFFFDNVGGDVLDEVLQRINTGARVVICGAVSQYSSGAVNRKRQEVQGPPHYIRLAETNSTMIGFTVTHHMVSAIARGLPYLVYQYWRKKLFLTEHIINGIESFPQAIEDMFQGGHTGRLLVDITGILRSEEASK